MVLFLVPPCCPFALCHWLLADSSLSEFGPGSIGIIYTSSLRSAAFALNSRAENYSGPSTISPLSEYQTSQLSREISGRPPRNQYRRPPLCAVAPDTTSARTIDSRGEDAI